MELVSTPPVPVPSFAFSKGIFTRETYVVNSIASRYRTFGSVTLIDKLSNSHSMWIWFCSNLLLSPQGDSEAGSFHVLEAVWTAERTNLPARVSPMKRFAVPTFFSSLYFGGFGGCAGFIGGGS